MPTARGLALLTPTCVSASRLAGGSAPRPLAASQHVALAALNPDIQLLLIYITLAVLTIIVHIFFKIISYMLKRVSLNFFLFHCKSMLNWKLLYASVQEVLIFFKTNPNQIHNLRWYSKC